MPLNLPHVLSLTSQVSQVCEVLGMDGSSIRADITPSGGLSFDESSEQSCGIRLVRNGRTGVAGATSMVDTALLVEMAIASSRIGPEENLQLPATIETGEVELFDSVLEKIEVTGLSDRLLHLKEALNELSPYAMVAGFLKLSRKRISLINSCGASGDYLKYLLEWKLRFSFPTGEGFFVTGSSAASGRDIFDPESLAREAAELATWAKSTTTPPDSNQATVFYPAAVSVLLQAIRAGVSGRSLVNGSSPLTGHVGSAVLSPHVSIWDRPTMDYGASSAPFDSEGVATRDKPLFEKGVFKGFLFDLVTAAAAGTRSTGSAGRNLFQRPEPVCTNLAFERGCENAAQIIGSIRSGLLVTDILSGEGGNTSTGDFVFDSCNAFRISDGEVSGRIPGALIRGNVYDLLKSANSISDSLSASGTDLLPHIRTDGVTIG